MNLLRLVCLAVLLTFSSSGHTLIDGYYSQAVDIDYALPGEDESIRVTLERAIKKFLRMVTMSDDEDTMGLDMGYFGEEEDLTSVD